MGAFLWLVSVLFEKTRVSLFLNGSLIDFPAIFEDTGSKGRFEFYLLLSRMFLFVV